jgi:hypothetical protein
LDDPRLPRVVPRMVYSGSIWRLAAREVGVGLAGMVDPI